MSAGGEDLPDDDEIPILGTGVDHGGALVLYAGRAGHQYGHGPEREGDGDCGVEENGACDMKCEAATPAPRRRKTCKQPSPGQPSMLHGVGMEKKNEGRRRRRKKKGKEGKKPKIQRRNTKKPMRAVPDDDDEDDEVQEGNKDEEEREAVSRRARQRKMRQNVEEQAKARGPKNGNKGKGKNDKSDKANANGSPRKTWGKQVPAAEQRSLSK